MVKPLVPASGERFYFNGLKGWQTVGPKHQAEMTENQKLEVMRHSAAHVMAAAVLSIFPDAKLGIGPAIAHGFYYD